ncbi:MAG: hypothetical protein EOP34_07010 [Rickettsiales bacterium]|nr:MAG: hypothetical protein EOP34_07010 [Rickettsiales bacterium]
MYRDFRNFLYGTTKDVTGFVVSNSIGIASSLILDHYFYISESEPKNTERMLLSSLSAAFITNSVSQLSSKMFDSTGSSINNINSNNIKSLLTYTAMCAPAVLLLHDIGYMGSNEFENNCHNIAIALLIGHCIKILYKNIGDYTNIDRFVSNNLSDILDFGSKELRRS